MSPERTFAPIAIAVGIVLTLMISGCGSSASNAKSGTLNAKTIQVAIAKSAVTQRDLNPAVTCPAGIQIRKGKQFYCVAQIAKRISTFKVTETSDAGAVSYVGLKSGQAPLLNTAHVAARIKRSVSRMHGDTARVECPVGIPRQSGLPFICVAAIGTARTRDFRVTQLNGSGRVKIKAL